MVGSNKIFNYLFVSFQNNPFFADAMYDLTWVEEISSGIDRDTGEALVTKNTYEAKSFLLNPSKSERPMESILKNYQAGDIVVLSRQEELMKKPPLDHEVVFDGETYICKGVAKDSIKVSWKILLRK